MSAIRYVEGLENYVKIFVPGQMHVVRITIKELEARLPKDRFVRISKSHLVGLLHTRHIDTEYAQVGEQALRIGRVFERYVDEQLQRLTV